MGERRRISDQAGFTVREVVLGALVLFIVCSVAVPAYRSFSDRAQMVEGELALHKIQQLQEEYHLLTGTYSADLKTLGFTARDRLKYYTIQIQLGTDGVAATGEGNGAGANSFQYRATAKAGEAALQDWVLTLHHDGTTDIRKARAP